MYRFPAVGKESRLRLPSHRDRLPSIQRPLPVDAPVERVGQPANIRLRRSLAIEVSAAGERPGEQEGRVDRRQLAIPGATARVHVQKVIVEALVAGRIRLLALRALPEGPQGRERPRRCLGAREILPLDADGVSGQPKSDGRDARGRPTPGVVRHQPGGHVGLLQEIPEGVSLEFIERLVAHHRLIHVLFASSARIRLELQCDGG